MAFLDIVIFALITLFFIQRLKSVLGQRGEREEQTSPPPSVVEVTGKEALPPLEMREEGQKRLSELLQWDKNFSIDDFYKGAAKAFEMILNAYASGRIETLQMLLSPGLLKQFMKVIEERTQKGWVQLIEIVSFLRVSLEKIEIDQTVASITLHFLTEQTNVTKNKNGEIEKGTLNLIEEIEDHWTFQKDKNLSKDIWVLTSIQSHPKSH
jgi:predicted lipid-binding transport protein (Tim44 family)